MKVRLLVFCLFLAALVVVPPLFAAEPPQPGGTLEGQLADGTVLQLPVLKTDVDADVRGDLATVTVTQTFANPSNQPMHASYLFPLNHEAAVFEMVMEVGEERIRAQVQEVQQAQKTFEKAKGEGRAAALLKEHRPNMFTQQIANLMPGLPIITHLRYVQAVPKVDGPYELTVPLVVGPRFEPPREASDRPPAKDADEPATSQAPEADPKSAEGLWQIDSSLPAYPPVAGLNLPPSIEPDRVAIHVRIDGGLPLQGVISPTHALKGAFENGQVWSGALAAGRTIDNRDFVLRYTLAGAKTDAGLLAYHDGRGGFFSLLLEPPAVPAAADITPREMVFLLDCSGSMDGLPIDASKAFMRAALRKLRPTDTFRIVRFSDRATEFSSAPLPATPENIVTGIRYTDSLNGEGGTMMTLGIEQALAPPVPEGSVRIVTFLTDGYIGNEQQILALIKRRLNGARLYAFGVGTGVNHYLLDEIGRAGRGFTRYMDPTEDTEKVAAELTDKLQSPVLTDISVDWGALAPSEVYPAEIPDLFAGGSVRIAGRYAKPGLYKVTVKGKVNGRPAALPLTVALPEASQGGDAVALVWARAAIRDAMYEISNPASGQGSASFDAIRKRVTDLGLSFSLLTRWTSFVAVSEKVYNANPAGTKELPVPLPMVKGVTANAYGNHAAFTGAAGPEPAQWLGLGLLGLLLLAFFREQRLRKSAAR